MRTTTTTTAATAALLALLLTGTPSGAAPRGTGADRVGAALSGPSTADGVPTATATPTTPTTATTATATTKVSAAGAAAAHGDPADHVVVRFADDVDRAGTAAALAAAGAEAGQVLPGTGLVVVPATGGTPSLVEALGTDARVTLVQPDHVRTVAGLPDDQLLHEWGTDSLDLARVPRAWDASVGAGVVVAVLDTGVQHDHADLAGQLLPGIDLVNGDLDPADDHGHGTMVAGILAASGDNAVGTAGVAFGASILPVKVADADGSARDSVTAEGIAYAVAHGADILTLPLAGPDPAPVLRAAIADAVAGGVLVVAPAGNGWSEAPMYPAAYAPDLPGLLAVGATDGEGTIMASSSWGDAVSLTAPGRHVAGPELGHGYSASSGSSVAAAVVSGVAALAIAHDGGSPRAVADRLTSSARDAGPRGIDPFYGAGLVDAAAALGLGAGLPLDRAPDEVLETPGASGDTPREAGAASGPVSGSFSPEGDEDWYRYDLPRGRYEVSVRMRTDWRAWDPDDWTTDPVLEVRTGTDAVVAVRDENGLSQPESALVTIGSAGTVTVGVRNANGKPAHGRRDVNKYDVEVTRLPDEVFTPHAHAEPAGVPGSAVGDLTGDGALDVALPRPTGLVVRPGLGDGRLGDPRPLPVPAPTGAVTALDLDGDGRDDLAVGTASGVQPVLLGAGTAVPAAEVPVPGDVARLTPVDWDRDGDDDLVVGSTGQILLSDGRGGFAPGPVFTPAGRHATGDVTGDGRPDVVLPHTVRAQRADGSLADPADLPEHEVMTRAELDVAVGDVTGDGLADVVRADRSGTWPMVTVTPQLPAGGFGPPASYGPVRWVRDVATGDVDGDGRADVVLALDGPYAQIFHQTADGRLGDGQHLPLPHAPADEGLVLADLDADRVLDAVVTATGSVTTLRQRPFAATPTTPALWLNTSVAPHRAGLPVRPTLTVSLGRPVAPGSVTARTVRLRAGARGADVPVVRRLDPATGALTVVPTVDLEPGQHYALWVGGLTDLAGTPHPGTLRTWFTVGADGDRFTPVAPWRVLDTRERWPGPVVPGAPRRVHLQDPAVPLDASAVVLNVTAVDPSAGGNVRVYPATADGGDPPTISNLNVVPGVTQPNLVTVALGHERALDIAVDGLSAHVVVDVAGYYAPGGATGYEPVDPVRVMDSRDRTGGVPPGPVRAGRWVDLLVTGRHGVPADAGAVVLNVTGVFPSVPTNIRVYPTPADSEDQTPPMVSNLNLEPGRDQPNLVTVAVGDGGRVRFFSHSADVHLVADLAGYYSPTGDHGFVALTPRRVVDSREGLGLRGPVSAGASSVVSMTGRLGVPAGASAAVLNVTAVSPRGASNVRIFPTPASPAVPLVSNLNVLRGRDEPNMAIVRLPADGRLSVFAESAAMDVVIDAAGYFRR